MFRAPLRRRLRPPPSISHRTTQPTARRTLSTNSSSSGGSSSSSSKKRGTWRGTALRWGAALGAVYWYNTSPMFSEDVAPLVGPPPPAFDHDEKTVDAVIAEKKREIEQRTRERKEREAAEAAKKAREEKKDEQKNKKQEESKAENPDDKQQKPDDEAAAAEAASDPAGLASEADQQGAFNPETGEINWDCPCLGGMAHGPCGEDFRAAFSCFVFSKEEPKGMDCIDKFQSMQDCFRKHPEVYGEIDEDDDENNTQETSKEGKEEKTPPSPETTTTAGMQDTAIQVDSPIRSSGKTELPAEKQEKEKAKEEGES